MDIIQLLVEKWKADGSYYQNDVGSYPYTFADFEEAPDLPLLNRWVKFLLSDRPNALMFGLQVSAPIYLKDIPNEFTEMALESSGVWTSFSKKLSPPDMWIDTRICIATRSSSGLFLDLCPGPEGKRGQVVFYVEGFDYQKVVFDSLEELFSSLLAGAELLTNDFDLVLAGGWYR
jgi:hypothetical protein